MVISQHFHVVNALLYIFLQTKRPPACGLNENSAPPGQVIFYLADYFQLFSSGKIARREFFPNKKTSVQEVLMKIRHRAIFPGLDDPSIVTAARLNCCVRYGNRCLPRAMGTDLGFMLKI